MRMLCVLTLAVALLAGQGAESASLPATSDIPNDILTAVSSNDAARVGGLLKRTTASERARHLSTLVPVPDHNFGSVGLLHIAGLNGHMEVLKVLLAAGAKPTLASGTGATVLDAAVQEGHVDMALWLLASGPGSGSTSTSSKSESKSRGGRARRSDRARAAALAKAPTRDSGWSPLHYAAEKHMNGVVDALIKAGAEVDVANGGVTPAYSAALVGNVGGLRSLLDAGADPNARRESSGATLLHAAVATNVSESVERVIGAGADVNTVIGDGLTVLHVAAELGDVDVVAVLLAAPGIRTNAKTNAGHTARDYALSKGHIEVADLLKDAGVDAIIKATHVRASFARTLLKIGLGSFSVFIAPLLICKALAPARSSGHSKTT